MSELRSATLSNALVPINEASAATSERGIAYLARRYVWPEGLLMSASASERSCLSYAQQCAGAGAD